MAAVPPIAPEPSTGQAEQRRAGVSLSAFEWGCLAVIVAAFALRAATWHMTSQIWDTAWFVMLARSFGEDGTFWIRWTHPPEYSGYWPPLFIAFLSVFIKIFGASFTTAGVAATTASALLTATVWATTRDLFGRTRAFAAAALVAASPAFLTTDGTGMSESLLSLAVTIALWGYLKSLQKPAFIAVALVGGLLAYLGKASLGLPFVGAGVLALGGLRVSQQGFAKTLRNPIDLSLIGLGAAGSFFFAATRTGKVGSIGLGIIEPVRIAIHEPLWLPVFLFKVFFALSFLLAITLPLSLWLRPALRNLKNHARAVTLLAVIAPILLGAVFTTSFFFTEHRSLVDFDNIRYLTPAVVPAIWLLIPQWAASGDGGVDRSVKGHAELTRHRRHHMTAVALMTGLLLVNPTDGTPTLPRFMAFVGLAIVPLGFAIAAYATRVRLVTTDGGRRVGPVRSYASAGSHRARINVIVLATGLTMGWFMSVYYAGIAIAFVVAASSSSQRRALLAMTILFAAATSHVFTTSLPVDSVADELAALGPGAVVGIHGPAVYLAAVAPDSAELHLVDPDAGLGRTYDALVTEERDAPPDGYVEHSRHNYVFQLSWNLQLRVWLEQNVLGRESLFEDVVGYIVYVPADSTAAAAG